MFIGTRREHGESGARYYYERPIDHQLLHKAQEWVTGSAWRKHISLVAPPGRGATATLEYLTDRVLEGDAFEDTCTLYLRPRERRHEDAPDQLSDLAAALVQFDDPAKPGALESLLARWRNAPLPRRLLLAVGIPLALTLLGLGLALDAYAGTDQAKSLPPYSAAYWRVFFFDWMWTPSNLLTLPVAAIAALLVAVASGAFSYFLPDRAPRDLTAEDKARLNAPKTLLSLLERCGRGMRAVMLIVDDRHLLSPTDAEALRLVRKGALKRTRILLITRDLTDAVDPALDDPHATEHVPLPDLSDADIRNIVSWHMPDLSASDLQRAVERGRVNLHDILTFEAAQEATSEDILAEFRRAYEADTDDEFGLGRLMVYWAVARKPFVVERELGRWIDTLEPAHLATFQLRRPESPIELIKAFRQLSIVRREGRTLHFDPNACLALVRALDRDAGDTTSTNGSAADIVKEAHCFWAARLAGELKRDRNNSLAFEPTTGTQGLLAKQAADHWSRVHPTAIPTGAPDRIDRLDTAGRVLVMSAAALRFEGEFADAEDAALAALDWAAALPEDRRSPIDEAAVSELWAGFLATWSDKAREGLTRLAERRPELTRTAAWIANECYRNCHMRTKTVPARTLPPGAASSVTAVWLLGSALADARQRYGFIESALADPQWVVPDPPLDGGRFAHALWELRALAALARKDNPAAAIALEQWRTALTATAGDDLWIAAQTWNDYQTARFEHVALSAGSLAMLADSKGQAPMAPQLLERIQSRYSNVSASASLLGMRPLLTHAAFHAAQLLREHTPAAQRESDPEWWRSWEPLYDISLRVEAETEWTTYTPAVHKARWQFFSSDENARLRDLFNIYLAVTDAGYPVSVICEWHQLAAGTLNDFGSTVEHRQWSAELYETWATTLAKRPEALPYRTFQVELALEQSLALLYAAQARRLGGQYDIARTLLDRADTLAASERPQPPDPSEDPVKVRGHRLSLRLQRYWLEETVERDPRLIGPLSEHPAAVLRGLWRDLLPGDSVIANTMLSLVGLEVRSGTATGHWPPTAGASPAVDPDNPQLSLPDHWFASGSMPISNRFEFRFLQLLSLVGLGPNADAASFRFQAFSGWSGQNHFAEVVLAFTRMDLDHQLLRHHRTPTIRLLDAVRIYFHNVRSHESELTSLIHLIRYKPGVGYEKQYVALLLEHQMLLKREFERRKADPSHWQATAERFHEYFGILTNSELLTERMIQAVTSAGRSPQSEVDRQQTLRRALGTATSLLAAHRYGEALATIEPHLQATSNGGWSTLDDVRALNLWLTCASHVPMPSPRLQFWAGEVRNTARAVIGQLTSSLGEPRLERLTSDLLLLLD